MDILKSIGNFFTTPFVAFHKAWVEWREHKVEKLNPPLDRQTDAVTKFAPNMNPNMNPNMSPPNSTPTKSAASHRWA